MFLRMRKARIPLVGAVIVFAFLLMAMNTSASPNSGNASGVVGISGYNISVFAKGTSAYSHPDAIVASGKYIYVGYQNVTAKDGSDNKSSTIVQYDRDGEAFKTFSFKGHCDGLRVDPATGLLWVTSNEDGNPNLATINPKTGIVTYYKLPATPHGGGYDDLAFANGQAFMAASNPTLNSAGINVFPAVVSVKLSGGNAILTPVLMGNATSLDTTTNKNVTLNLTDPDSMTIDDKGNVVLVDQADSVLVTLHNAGTSKQTVTSIPVGTQLDDTVWATSKEATLFIVDGPKNVIYSMKVANDKDFVPGTVYTEAPKDSGVASFVGTIDVTTGIVTPILVGFGSPTGLLFVPN